MFEAFFRQLEFAYLSRRFAALAESPVNLLKNELSLSFLRNLENIVQTLKCAIRIWASEDEQNRTSEEVNELTWIMKILTNAPVEHQEKSEAEEEEVKEETKEEQFIPQAELENE